MNAQDLNALPALYNAPQFLADHSVALGSVARTPAARELSLCLALVEQRAYQQDLGAANVDYLTATIRSLRHTAVIQARLAVRIAHELLADRPDLAALRAPPMGAPTEALIGALNTIANAVVRHSEAFHFEGLASDAVANLRELARRLQDTIAERVAAVRANKRNTAGLTHDLRRARTAYRVVDAFIRAELVANPRLLAVWRRLQDSTQTAAA